MCHDLHELHNSHERSDADLCQLHDDTMIYKSLLTADNLNKLLY